MTDEVRKQVIDNLLNNKDITNLIAENMPKSLYKYRSGNEWDLDALETDSIWMSRADKMDDPIDARILLDERFKRSIEYVVNNVDCFNNEKYRVHLLDNAIQKDCFICSFSELRDSEDMWTMYANNEQGFCIEYDTHSLYTKNNLLLLPVCYDEKKEYSVEDIASLSKKQLLIMNFLIKNKFGINNENWYVQREWRMLAFRKTLNPIGDRDLGKCIRTIKPRSVILGHNVSETVKSRINEWAAKEENQHIIVIQK